MIQALLQGVVRARWMVLFLTALVAAFGAWMAVWGQRANPPTVTGFRVAGLSNPDFLIEIEATACLP